MTWREQLGDVLVAVADRVRQPPRKAKLIEVAQKIAGDWKESSYYDAAEAHMERGWTELIWPMIHDCDFSTVVDLAAGHGRNTPRLRQLAKRVYVADVNQENLDYCRRRFGDDPDIKYVLCDGASLSVIRDESISLLYCFDAMVHFDSDTVREYLKDFCRILRPGGRGFCHHSNYIGGPAEGDYRRNPSWRNFMSKELFEHSCYKEGLTVIRSKVIDWDGHAGLDCMTVFEKRAASTHSP